MGSYSSASHRSVSSLLKYLASRNFSAPIHRSRYKHECSRIKLNNEYEDQEEESSSTSPIITSNHPSSYFPSYIWNRSQEAIGSKYNPKRSRRRARQLLGFGGDKSESIQNLLRAPVTLAACFSFLLLVSLATLFGLSFHSHHKHQLQLHQHQQHKHQHQPKFSTKVERASGNNEDESNDEISRRFFSSFGGLDESATDDALDNANRDPIPNNNINGSSFDRSLTVQTECGSYVGVPRDGAFVFHGLPYASPPIGARRWTRPKPIWLDEQLCRPNEIVHLANHGRTHCAQLSPITRRFSGHEDCLYADIYTPQLGSVGDQVEVSSRRELYQRDLRFISESQFTL